MSLKTALLIALLTTLPGCQRANDTASMPAEGERAAPAAAATSVAKPEPPARDVGQPTGGEAAGDKLTPSSAAECTQRGGTWRTAGLMKLEVCDMPMADAGKACQGDSDCESVCVAPEGADPSGPVMGQCYRSNITVGTCLTLVEGGRISQAQCAD